MRILSVLFTFILLVALAGCQSAPPAEPPAPAAKAYANLAQLMHTLPFPNANIIFDTQSKDPEAAKEGAADTGAGATAQYGSLYGGWKGVEDSSMAMAETANLLLIPGRLCENGMPVPVDREDFKKFVQGLVEAGQAAYKAAQTKNMDAMVEVSGTVSDACLACHEVYRDQPGGKQRCTP